MAISSPDLTQHWPTDRFGQDCGWLVSPPGYKPQHPLWVSAELQGLTVLADTMTSGSTRYPVKPRELEAVLPRPPLSLPGHPLGLRRGEIPAQSCR